MKHNRFLSKSVLPLTLLLSFATLSHAQQPVPSDAAKPVTPSTDGSVAAISGVVILRTSISSKGTVADKEIKATLNKPMTLPDGISLPKGTVLIGKVAQVSAHRKAQPNGAMLLSFTAAQLKDGTFLPLVVKIRSLAQPAADENAAIALPGARIGGTSNSGGSDQLTFEMSDHSSSLHSNLHNSGLAGVYLNDSAGGSGAVFALGEDVYLDSGVQIGILLAHLPSK